MMSRKRGSSAVYLGLYISNKDFLNDGLKHTPQSTKIYNKCVEKCWKHILVIIHRSVGESGEYLPRRFAARLISTTIHLHFGE